MDTIDLELPLRLCDYFDIIKGTSTGGSVCIDYFTRFKADEKCRLIAVMLGQL